MNYPLIGISSYELSVQMQPPFKMAGVNVDYKNAVIRAGGIPVMIPQDLLPDQVPDLVERLDGVIISGGGDIHPRFYGQTATHPRLMNIDMVRDETERRLVCAAIERDRPILAICRGHQMLNVALGGTLYQDVETQYSAEIKHDYFFGAERNNYIAHTIDVEPDSKLATLLGHTHINTNSRHHQAIDQIGKGLVVTARATGDDMIEAVEYPEKRFVVGVQWHPENLQDTVLEMRGLFTGLVEAARTTEKVGSEQ